MKVVVDLRSNYLYSSSYYLGLDQMAGGVNVSYNMTPFRELGDIGKNLRFIIKEGNREKKCFFHLNDSYRIV